jgi:AFG3 family protein
MADKEKKIQPPKLPKTNYQTWLILGLIAVVLIITQVYKSPDMIEVLDGRFEEMVTSRNSF